MHFTISGELSALMPIKETSTGTHLYEEVKKMLQSLSTPIQNKDGLVTDGAPSMAERNSGVSSFITDTNNKTDFDLITCH
jgi:hypothetical protein